MVRLSLFTLDDGECADAAWVMLDHHFTVKPEVSHDGRETAVYIYILHGYHPALRTYCSMPRETAAFFSTWDFYACRICMDPQVP